MPNTLNIDQKVNGLYEGGELVFVAFYSQHLLWARNKRYYQTQEFGWSVLPQA